MSTQPALTSSELKGERVKPVTGRELRLVIALCVVLVAAANAGARWAVDRWSPNTGFLVYQTKWNQLRSLSQPIDWLVLGDSSANQGLDPERLERRLGGRALNLATIADAGAVTDAWMLQQVIARVGPPRAVILVHAYDMWSRPFQYQLMAEAPLPWGYWNDVEPRVEMGLRRTLQVAGYRYVPLYTRQESLLLLLRGRTEYGERPVITDRGFMKMMHARPHDVAADARAHLAFTREHTFTMSPENSRALDTIAALADRYQFDVFIANAPLYAGVYDDDAFRAYYTTVAETLHSQFVGNRHVHYLFQSPMLFQSDVMQNVDHLTTVGAIRYSDELARRLEKLTPPLDEASLAPQRNSHTRRQLRAQAGDETSLPHASAADPPNDHDARRAQGARRKTRRPSHQQL